MSSISDSPNPSGNAECPRVRNVKWLKTVYWQQLMDFRKTKTGQCLRATPFDIPGTSSSVYLDLKRKSRKVLSITCHRTPPNPDEVPCEDYLYRFYIIVLGVKEKPWAVTMRYNEYSSTHDYDISSFPNFTARIKNHICVKCVIRMIELTNLSKKAIEEQASIIVHKIMPACESEERKNGMIYITGHSTMGYMLKNRQVYKNHCRLMKLILTAASDYAKEISEFMRARERQDPQLPNIPLEDILSRLLGRKNSITVETCYTLLGYAYIFGLDFLRILCSAYLMKNINTSRVLSIISIADNADDTELFKDAALYFLSHIKEILGSTSWTMFTCAAMKEARSVIHNIYYRYNSDDWLNPSPYDAELVD